MSKVKIDILAAIKVVIIILVVVVLFVLSLLKLLLFSFIFRSRTFIDVESRRFHYA